MCRLALRLSSLEVGLERGGKTPIAPLVVFVGGNAASGERVGRGGGLLPGRMAEVDVAVTVLVEMVVV
jgi:hypothetical protein